MPRDQQKAASVTHSRRDRYTPIHAQIFHREPESRWAKLDTLAGESPVANRYRIALEINPPRYTALRCAWTAIARDQVFVESRSPPRVYDPVSSDCDNTAIGIAEQTREAEREKERETRSSRKSRMNRVSRDSVQRRRGEQDLLHFRARLRTKQVAASSSSFIRVSRSTLFIHPVVRARCQIILVTRGMLSVRGILPF